MPTLGQKALVKHTPQGRAHGTNMGNVSTVCSEALKTPAT